MAEIEWGQWYVLQTKPHKESLVEAQVTRQGVELFYPRLLTFHPRPSRRRIVPLFPGYLFVRLLSAAAYEAIRWLPGVARLVSFHETPAPVEDAVITFLRQRANAQGVLSAGAPFAVGQEAEIVEGPFAGLAGIIAHPPNARDRVRLLVQLLKRQVTVDVPLHMLKPKQP
jgi:transcriptional antiterminator RfaH